MKVVYNRVESFHPAVIEISTAQGLCRSYSLSEQGGPYIQLDFDELDHLVSIEIIDADKYLAREVLEVAEHPDYSGLYSCPSCSNSCTEEDLLQRTHCPCGGEFLPANTVYQTNLQKKKES